MVTLSKLKIVIITCLVVACVAVILSLAIVLTRCADPENIKPAKDVNVTLSNNHTLIEWTPISVSRCNTKYHVWIQTEKTLINTTIENPSFELPRNLICYRGVFVVEAIIGNTIAEIAQGGINYKIDQPTNIIVSASGDVLNVKWNFPPLELLCNIVFEVRVLRGDHLITFIVYSDNIVIDRFYCVDTNVYVKATNFFYSSEYTIATHLAEYPTSLDPASNIKINRTEAFATISWRAQYNVMECSDLYTVNAINPATREESQCQGTTECKITLSNSFCPTTVFTIAPTSASGNETTKIYSCSEDVLI